MIPLSRLKRLAAEHGTPLFVLDHDEIRKNYAEFKKHLPRVQVYYAVKANPNPDVLKVLALAGLGFDVASPQEIVTEPRMRISALSRPDALVRRSDFSELLQTSSASEPVRWTGVSLVGRISYRRTRTPARAACHAASAPANPPPMIVISRLLTISPKRTALIDLPAPASYYTTRCPMEPVFHATSQSIGGLAGNRSRTPPRTAK
jgi:hypothetical protein